ncbi:hypothetical protein DOJK_00115 [Patescibacteria group bacterium]|nr:hypothetical protein [Candidatus Dojkabacteria bacterium]CAG1020131.1 hypothetical protein DOJK_00115 [Patescibacteria group bacterium]
MSTRSYRKKQTPSALRVLVESVALIFSVGAFKMYFAVTGGVVGSLGAYVYFLYFLGSLEISPDLLGNVVLLVPAIGGVLGVLLVKVLLLPLIFGKER